MVLVWLLGMATAAYAQTDEIQVYDAQIAAPGQFNLTWHNNYTVSGRGQAAFPGGIVPNHALADFGPLQHFRSGPTQAQSLFVVVDYGSDSNGIELGIGRGLTSASDATVIKLIVTHDL